MQANLRQQLTQHLWQIYRSDAQEMLTLEAGLKELGIHTYHLDHFAIIDLPGKNSGIPVLQKIFGELGYEKRGAGYLPAKQNDFTWLAEKNCSPKLATDVLPQIVIADFRLHEMPVDVRGIIEKYAALTAPAPTFDAASSEDLPLLLYYFNGRDWPLPTKEEYERVNAFNPLLAWVLIFGRRPNHFTLSLHLLDEFTDLKHFNAFLTDTLHLQLNTEGGTVKGTPEKGILQSSTLGVTKKISLVGGDIFIPSHFIEFVWRFPKASVANPQLWQDYFNDFIAEQADYVIESLYNDEVVS